MKIRKYQEELAQRGKLLLKEYHLLYLAMEMRVGKTIIALRVADLMKFKSVLFLTKKRAISSIKKDYKELSFKFDLTVINYESIHKVILSEFDLIVCDEAHTLGAFPKPSHTAKYLHDHLDKANTPIIYLSGTPTPESYSQIYHQLWISRFTPFGQWPTFYKWAHGGFVVIQSKFITGRLINDYTFADKGTIQQYINKFFLTYTQREAKFEVTELTDSIKIIPCPENIHKLVKLLLSDRVYIMKDRTVILGETAAKLKQKVHQIYSGSVISEVVTEDGSSVGKQYNILDDYKVKYILDNYKNKKIAIYYLYQSEGDMLKNKIMNWTNDPDYFNKSGTETVFISQFQSGARGINLSSAEIIIFFNIHFSSELYQQARQRGQEKEKSKETELHWLFSDIGIEQKIYQRVLNKQTYTTYYFKEDFYD